MKLIKTCAVIVPALLLAGCLESEQHPPWIDGEYAGKPDNRHYEVRFHHDRLAWWATVDNRNQKQNEYNRANP